jgi:hypothetical protein
MTFFNTKPIQGEKPMNTFHARNPIIIACLAIAGLVLATPALASNPLLFEWSGVDEDNNPFTISYTVTDVQSGEAGYDSNFFDASGWDVSTEEVGEKQVITDMGGDVFAGTYTYPTTTTSDPYYYLSAYEDSGDTYIYMLGGADNSNIGLTYDGNPVLWVEIAGTADYAFIDPTTATSLADIFPVGTYTITPDDFFDGFGGQIVMDSSAQLISPTSLTISVIPEPTSLALLGLGGLAMLRRRHHV